MTDTIEKLASKQPLTCAVCHRRATDIAYVTETRKTLYLCGDPGCIAGAHRLKHLDLDRLEEDALSLAGKHAGNYLDTIGITDLTELDGDQWTTFLKMVVNSFEVELRDLILAENPPF